MAECLPPDTRGVIREIFDPAQYRQAIRDIEWTRGDRPQATDQGDAMSRLVTTDDLFECAAGWILGSGLNYCPCS